MYINIYILYIYVYIYIYIYIYIYNTQSLIPVVWQGSTDEKRLTIQLKVMVTNPSN